MQAIITKYLCPTNFNGSRIRAQCDAMSMIISWDDELNPEENHIAACNELCKRLDARSHEKYGTVGTTCWLRPKVTAGLPNNSGMVHVFIPQDAALTAPSQA